MEALIIIGILALAVIFKADKNRERSEPQSFSGLIWALVVLSLSILFIAGLIGAAATPLLSDK